MGHNSIQPWHYGFCDLSHAQSAVKGEQKGSTSGSVHGGAHNGGVAAVARQRLFRWKKAVRASKAWPGREGMAWRTILTGHGVMNGASEIFFLFNWRCQKPFIHCTAKLQMVP